MPAPITTLLALTLLVLTAVLHRTGVSATSPQCPTTGHGLVTQGLSHLQRRAQLLTQQPHEASELPMQPTAQPPVFLTYCDAAFKPIFSVFYKCYQAALGNEMVSHLLDLGQCMPPPVPVPASALVDTATSADGEVTPPGVPLVIARGLAEQLEGGRDVFRIDADAFIMKNPIHEMRDRHPVADVVSSIDCAFIAPKYCGWYRTQVFMQRHGGRDPISELGFMLNTGFALFRSNPRTVKLARDTERAMAEGRSDFEQTALNEELIRRNCTWSTEEGPMHGSASQAMLYQKHFHGICADGLRIVVLPYNVVTRSTNNATGKLAVHPGGSTEYKLSVLPQVASDCISAAAARATRI